MAKVDQIVAQRFPSIGRGWRTLLRNGTYVPSAAEQHLIRLKQDGPEAFVRDLDRLASLGNPWAAALLGYQALLLGSDDARDTQKAIALCTDPAAHGDAFAQYILAWALLLAGNSPAAAKALKQSALQLFPPAILHSVTFFWNGWGVTKTDDSTILLSLKNAGQTGHRATLSLRCAIYRSGKLGVFRQTLGFLLTPIAMLLWAVATFRTPFSAQVFAFDTRASGHLARSYAR